MKLSKIQLSLIGLLAISIIAGVVLILIFARSSQQFAKPDKKLSNGTVELCSGYAKLCFIRPADWTRSSILHAGLAKLNDIEINPPTGTILRLEAISDDTNTACPSYATCDINTVGITHLNNGPNVVSGIFDTNSSNPNVVSGHMPFVQLVSSHDVHSYDLQVGKSTAYTAFNPGISFDNAPKVMLQISPGKGYNAKKAMQWLLSSEGSTAKQVLASVHTL